MVQAFNTISWATPVPTRAQPHTPHQQRTSRQRSTHTGRLEAGDCAIMGHMVAAAPRECKPSRRTLAEYSILEYDAA